MHQTQQGTLFKDVSLLRIQNTNNNKNNTQAALLEK